MRRLALLLTAALASPAAARTAPYGADTAAAVAEGMRAVEARPDDPAGYEQLGRVLLQAGRTGEAVETFRRLCAKVPGYAPGLYRLAFALRKDGQYGQAAEAYRAYIAKAPDDPDARYGLAATLEQLGDRDGALQAYRDYVRLESRPTEAKWVAKAKDAIERLQASATVEPAAEPAPSAAPSSAAEVAAAPASAAPASAADDGPDARFAHGDYAGARQGYEAELLRRPDAAVLAYRAGVSAALAGDARGAEADAARAALLDPGNPSATDLALLAHARGAAAESAPTLADAELALDEGRLRTAERMAAAALAAHPDPTTRARLEWVRGRALLALGRGPDALDALKTAAGLGLGDPALWVHLADAATLAGDAATARYYDALAARALPARHPLAERVRARLAGGPTSGRQP